MKSNPKHPGVYVQPPIFGIALFIVGRFLQMKLPINDSPQDYGMLKLVAGLLLVLSVILGATGVIQFFKARTTVETFRPASTLQTTGIYQWTRNPMYLGLIGLYLFAALIYGNWWTVIFSIFFFLILNFYVIPREENYLCYAFGSEYIKYKNRVRRWFGKNNYRAD